MTCFWDGILSSFDNEDFEIIGVTRNCSIGVFISKLKEKNCMTNNVSWNGEILHNKLKEENMIGVENYNIEEIHSGHLTSTCDYFLCLLCEILNVEIHHVYLGNKNVYVNMFRSRKILRYESNSGHFYRT